MPMKNKRKIIVIFLCLIFALVFLFSLWQILSKIGEYEKNKRSYAALVEKNVTVVTLPPQTEEEQKEIAPIKVDFDNLLKENEQVVGWLYCEGTPINYPVVQAKDNDYYLRRGLDGKYDIGGTIFMDYRNDAKMSNRNTMIYGHNMMNDTMFGTFVQYKKQAYYDAHPTIWYLTPDGDYKIELFAGYVTEPDAKIYSDFENRERMHRFINDALKQSTFKTKASVEHAQQIVTLSTCSYEFENARYVLLGILK